MATILYTLGYTGLKPDDLVVYLDHLGAQLIDVRMSPRSMQPRWTRAGLIKLVGAERYTHLNALGNKNYKTGGPIELQNPEAAVAHISSILAQRPGILLCGCADYRECHRTVAAEWLANRLGAAYVTQVVHLPTRFADFLKPVQTRLEV